MLIGGKDIQRFIVENGVTIKVDGIVGKRTRDAIAKVLTYHSTPCAKWGSDRRLVAIQQLILKQGNFDPGPIDGFIGPQTRYALER
jgi:peptidoglycan hydrolase-like protein with peptidoglycan-binding domain